MALDLQADALAPQRGTALAPRPLSLPGRSGLLLRAPSQLGRPRPPTGPACSPGVFGNSCMDQHLLWFRQNAGCLTETLSNPDKSNIYPIFHMKTLQAWEVTGFAEGSSGRGSWGCNSGPSDYTASFSRFGKY